MLHNVRVPGIPRRRRGFTIVEVVMAVIIIGILTLALVPTLVNHANNARLTICKQDLENLADAEERAAIDTGYLYRPYVLNDGSLGDGVANAPKIWPQQTGDPVDRINGIRDNAIQTNNLYGDSTYPGYYIFISPSTQDYLPTAQQDVLFTRLTGGKDGSLTNSSLAEQNFHWGGPYINWKRDEDHDDWPEDPWGHPYLFFTKVGMIYPPQHSQTSGSTPSSGSGDPTIDYSFPFQNSSGLQGGSGLTPGTNEPYYSVGGGGSYQWKAYDENSANKAPLFDRPTWLSLGPNGLPGSGTTTTSDPDYGYGKGDDLFYSFGGS